MVGRLQPPGDEPKSSSDFTEENITAKFISSIPQMTAEMNLEVVTATQTEIFTQSSNKLVLWGKLDLGTTVVQVQVPVTYRYHIPLRESWNLTIKGGRVLVMAPSLRASLPPSVHTDKMERLTLRGWARTSATPMLQELELQITPLLSSRAGSPEQFDLVREKCRSSVAEFVKLWLEREGQSSRFNSVEVSFADEKITPPPHRQKFLK